MIYNLEYKDDMGNLLFVSAYVYVKIIEQIAGGVGTASTSNDLAYCT